MALDIHFDLNHQSTHSSVEPQQGQVITTRKSSQVIPHTAYLHVFQNLIILPNALQDQVLTTMVGDFTISR